MTLSNYFANQSFYLSRAHSLSTYAEILPLDTHTYVLGVMDFPDL